MNTAEKKLAASDGAGGFWEARVSEALNVPRKTLAKLRGEHLTAGADFKRAENNAVVLTAEGMAKIEALLATPAPTPVSGLPTIAAKETGGKPPAKGSSKDVPEGPPRREIMVISRIPQNTGLLLCIPKKSAVLTVVRVRENTNFKAEMTIEAVQSGDGVWQFRNRVPGDESTVGRLPRNKGRW
jgi:hypothetical protein